jgi:hypothetical protein
MIPMKTYRHSGTLGDLIYSLSVVKKMAVENNAVFLVALNNIENCVAQYGYRPEEVDPAHKGRFTYQDYEWLRPLLNRQSYIQDTGTWTHGTPEPDVDLDRFRGVLFRGFEGNYVEAYHRTFGLPFSTPDYSTPWLEADPVATKPIVVSRTFRYRDPQSDSFWKDMAKQGQLDTNGIFLGTDKEHQDFVRVTGVSIPYHPVRDFLELANIVAGADMVMANQNFVYSLAMGLGKQSMLETMKIKPLQYNECYFPRENCQYI